MTGLLHFILAAFLSFVVVLPVTADDVVRKEHEPNTCLDDQGHNVGCPEKGDERDDDDQAQDNEDEEDAEAEYDDHHHREDHH